MCFQGSAPFARSVLCLGAYGILWDLTGLKFRSWLAQRQRVPQYQLPFDRRKATGTKAVKPQARDVGYLQAETNTTEKD